VCVNIVAVCVEFTAVYDTLPCHSCIKSQSTVNMFTRLFPTVLHIVMSNDKLVQLAVYIAVMKQLHFQI